MSSKDAENARTLASLLRIDLDDAARQLDITIAITAAPDDNAALALAGHVSQLLQHTVARAIVNGPDDGAAGEIVVGSAQPRRSDAVRVHVTPYELRIGASAPVARIPASTRPMLLLITACYTAARIMKVVFGSRLPVDDCPDLVIPVSTVFGADLRWLDTPIELHDTYLAGAGAVGNGFLSALRFMPVTGSLVIVDPDVVSEGNLNRCVWFTADDIDQPKATRLAEIAQPHFPELQLVARKKTLQEIGKEHSQAAWLHRMIVAVDSRRARRRLQYEIAREVFDASTTGIVECVLHHHVQPTEDACLACIYSEVADELAHERHVAETLGVTLEDVKQHYVSADAAWRIHARYPHIPAASLAGQAFDSLFKALCSEGKLLAPEGRQVLAPFAFVSVLAGTYLAIDLARRLTNDADRTEFNYWRVSPWRPPNLDLKATSRRNPDCEFCRQPVMLRTARRLWGSAAPAEGSAVPHLEATVREPGHLS
jgi:hypothetical protein